MFQIHTDSNKISPIIPKKFSELGFTERNHLQEWIAKTPESLGEDLLIIQKEFDGFDETRERLDLLALDKQGNLVVIENKLDDSGRDVVWQALKYASYCSSLSKTQIVDIYQRYLNRYEKGEDAREKIVEFLEGSSFEETLLNDGTSQRIIFIAAHFRKEVTSTVMWLLENQIRIQCFKTTPYKQGGQLLLTLDQIIPTPEEAEFRVGISQKQKEQKTAKTSQAKSLELRPRFWARILEELDNADIELYKNISPSKDHWLSTGSGYSAVHYSMIFSNKEIRIELVIARKETNENKEFFDELFSKKAEIERNLGFPLEWKRMNNKKSSYITYRKSIDGYNEENWNEMLNWFIKNLPTFENTFSPHILRIKQKK